MIYTFDEDMFSDLYNDAINGSEADEFGMDESLYSQCMDRIEYQDTYGYVYV